MARKSLIERDLKRQRLAKRFAARRAKLKAAVHNRSASAEDRFAASLKLAALPRNSAKNRMRRRCLLTGRSRGVYRKFGLSRIKLRELASIGQIPGMTRSSW